MRVVGFHQPGEPDVLEVIDLPDPSPGEGEVRIRVHAAAVSPVDIYMRRRARTPDSVPSPIVPGMDAAGVLEEIGPGVDTDLEVGDRVMAIVLPDGAHGAYSEQVVVPVESVARTPAGTDDVDA